MWTINPHKPPATNKSQESASEVVGEVLRKTFRGIVGDGTCGSQRLRVLCQRGDSMAKAFFFVAS